MRQEWTDDDITKLKKYFDAGLPFGEISELMGRSFSSINHKCSRLHWKRKQGRAIIRTIKGKKYWAVIKNRKPILVHRTIGEKIIGRPLKRNEVVHHKNNDGLDNRRCNLEVMTISEHMKLHYQDRELDSKGQFL